MRLLNKYWFVVLLFLVGSHLLFLTKLKFTAWPEMLLWPYLLVEGQMPYKDIAIAHTPLLVVALSVFYKLFETGILQLKVFTWLFVIATDLLLFYVTSKIWNKRISLAILAGYVFLQLLYDGNALWFDLALVPLSLIEFYLIYKNKYFLAGFMWVVMMLTKQTAIWFLIPIVATLLTRKTFRKNVTHFLLGSVLTSTVAIFSLAFFDILPHFYNWAVHFGLFILPHSSGQINLPSIRNLIVAGFPFLIFILYFRQKKQSKIQLLFWVVAGSLGAYPRFEYFHLQPSLPYLAMVTAYTLKYYKPLGLYKKIFFFLYLVGFIYLFVNFFIRNFSEGVRFYEKDVVRVADYIMQNTKPGDKIFVLNWWDSVYALTNTFPGSSPWVPQLEWYQEPSGIQEKEVLDLQTTKPKYIVFKPYEIVGLGAYIPKKLYEYVRVNYHVKDKIDGIEILIPNN